jgi:hypothetical protein
MFTPAEKNRIADYDRTVADQLRREKEYEDKPTKKPSLDPLFDALIAEAMESMRDANEEIGVFLKCKETFNGIINIADSADYFIRLAKYRIEENYNDVTRWRKEKESCRVRG